MINFSAKNTKLLVLYSYFVLLVIHITLQLYSADVLKQSGWILGDWLINYQDGGFKRRGLGGSFFFLLQDLTGIKLQYIVFVTQLSLYLTTFFLLLRILNQYTLNAYYWIIFYFSPVLFTCYLKDAGYIGRKDIIVITIFTWLVYKLSRQTFGQQQQWILGVLLIIATLLHELVVFFLPFFGYALFLNDKKINYKQYALLGLVMSTFVLGVLLFGAEINNGTSIALLSERGVRLGQLGIFEWENGYHLLARLKYEFYNRLTYVGIYVGMSIVFLHYVYTFDKTKLLSVIYFLSTALLFQIPLFLLAIDWGRWIHMYFTLLLIMLPLILDNNTLVTAKKRRGQFKDYGWSMGLILLAGFMLCFNMRHFMRVRLWNGFPALRETAYHLWHTIEQIVTHFFT